MPPWKPQCKRLIDRLFDAPLGGRPQDFGPWAYHAFNACLYSADEIKRGLFLLPQLPIVAQEGEGGPFPPTGRRADPVFPAGIPSPQNPDKKHSESRRPESAGSRFSSDSSPPGRSGPAPVKGAGGVGQREDQADLVRIRGKGEPGGDGNETGAIFIYRLNRIV